MHTGQFLCVDHAYLADEPLPRTVVSLAFAPTAELDLVPLEVRLGLLDLHKSLRFTASREHALSEDKRPRSGPDDGRKKFG